MKIKIWIWAIAACVLTISSLSCGENTSRAAGAIDLDRVTPRLPSGLSVEEVEGRLGEPDAQFEVEGSETVLTYGLWQVVFRPSLYKRTRRYVAGYRNTSVRGKALDHKIRGLELGSSRAEIERALGKTESWQILSFGKDERLWYGRGRWKLHLVDRRLAGRVRYG